MITITRPADINEILSMGFDQTVIEASGDETIEHGFIGSGDDRIAARCIYIIPVDGPFDAHSGEFLGEWLPHISRVEIDKEA